MAQITTQTVSELTLEEKRASLLMLLVPDQWANEAATLAKEYEGLPEAQIFLNTARRFRALSARIKQLEGFPYGSGGNPTEGQG
jgi:hypothetical protein